MPRDLPTPTKATPARLALLAATAAVLALSSVPDALAQVPGRPGVNDPNATAAPAGNAEAPEVADVKAIPANVRTSDSGATVNPAVDAFIKGQFDRLRTGEAASIAAAGDDLVQAGQGEASSTYYDAYSRALGQSVGQLVGGSDAGTMPARLAAAVAVESLARQTSNLRLIEPTQRLLADSHPAVALWGIAAVRPLAKVSVRQALPGEEPLIAGVVEAVKRHPGEGHLAHEAFSVLRDIGGGSFNAGGGEDVTVPERNRPQVVQATLELMELRLQEWGEPEGDPALPTTPDRPLADRPATQLLASGNIYPTLDAAAKTRVRTILRDLAARSAEASAVAAEALTVAPAEDRDRVLRIRDENRAILTATAQALESINGPRFDGNAAIASEARRIAELPRPANADTIRERAGALATAINGAYTDLAQNAE